MRFACGLERKGVVRLDRAQAPAARIEHRQGDVERGVVRGLEPRACGHAGVVGVMQLFSGRRDPAADGQLVLRAGMKRPFFSLQLLA
jgi:hypothetical protein